MEIIIGLPCSGKSYLCSEYEKKGYVIFDDFISHFYNGELIQKLEEKICIADPRLCNYDIFLKFISYFSEKKIHLILFENDPKACLNNLEKRKDGRKGISQSIQYLSSIYNLNNYISYDHAILPVYK